MTNAQILAQYCWELKCAKMKLRTLQKMPVTPRVIKLIKQLKELCGNLEMSIADLKGAIIAGADSPYSPWC